LDVAVFGHLKVKYHEFTDD
jgi:hypothetical protein